MKIYIFEAIFFYNLRNCICFYIDHVS
jgi:hypothetical protein